MKQKYKFLSLLSDTARQNFDYIESHGGHTERFCELLDNPTKEGFPAFSNSEIKLLGDEDLVTFSALYPSEAYLYKDNF